MNQCPYCNIDLPEPRKRGGHLRSCALNPRREERLDKMRTTLRSRMAPTIKTSCPRCGQDFETRGLRADKKFCSKKCAKSHKNSGPQARYIKKICKACSKEFGNGSSYRVYCSQECSESAKGLSFQGGQISNRATLKRHLLKIKAECFECGLTEWRGHKLPLEVHHIDGDASNNLPSNLQLVCANCHSVTPSWKGKNAGSGRKSRGLRQE